MSMRYRGGFITANPPAPTSTSASGVWNLVQQLMASAAGNWPVAPNGWAAGAASVGVPSASVQQAVIVDSAGNSYFIGGTTSTNSVAVTKVSAGGSVEWQKSYTGTLSANNAYGLAGVALSNGDIIVQGSYGASPNRMFLLRINPAGTVVAKNYYTGLNTFTFPAGIVVDSSDNVYFASYVSASSVSHFFGKINTSDLTVAWVKQFQGGPGYNSIAVSPDGTSLYLVGRNSNTAQSYIHKYNSSGTVVSSVVLATVSVGAIPTFLDGVSVDNSGNVFFLGLSGTNTYVYKLDSNLSVSWVRYVASTGLYNGATLWSRPDGSGGVYVVGPLGSTVINSGPTVYSAYFARFNSSGGSVFSNALPVNTTGSTSISVDSGNNVYIAARYQTNLLYQKIPTSLATTGLYAGGSAFFSYGGGPAFTSITSTSSSYSSAASTITMAEVTDTTNVSNLSNTFASTTYSYPLSGGSALYSQPGSYTWIAPAGVTSVSAVCIGGGGGGAGSSSPYSGSAGGGGALAYRNAISVTPGTGYTVTVGAGGDRGAARSNGTTGGQSVFVNTSTLYANPGTHGLASGGGAGAGGSSTTASGASAFAGGNGGYGGYATGGGGGGGAGGYAGAGGAGSGGTTGSTRIVSTEGTGGSASGGAGGGSASYGSEEYYYGGYNGGSVGVIGQGTSGAASSDVGVSGSPSLPYNFGAGGAGSGWYAIYTCCGPTYYNSVGNAGTGGAVRIVWGSGRSFPSTNVSTP